MVMGALAVICMFMNWFPVSLDLGVVRYDEILGRVNAINLFGVMSELEENLGALASVLPSGFHELKQGSANMVVCAVITIALYLVSSYLICRKKKFMEFMMCAASAGAIITVIFFYSTVTKVYNAFDVGTYGKLAASIVFKSPCVITLLAGIVSGFCTETVSGVVMDAIGLSIANVKNLAMCILEWIEMFINNIGYLVSDIVGVYAGILVGKTIWTMTGSRLVGTLVGFAAAGLVACVCCGIVWKVFMNQSNRGSAQV